MGITMVSNHLDEVLQTVCPTVMVPRYEALLPLESNGHRFLAAGDGLYAEIRRPWVRSVFRIAKSVTPLPYGKISASTHFSLDRGQFSELIGRFILEAREVSPKEHATWLSFEDGDGLAYEPVAVESSSSGHICYHRPDVTGKRVLAVDLHSHGRAPAFWSTTDNHDDNDDAKLAIVFGNLDAPQPTVMARFLALGVTIDFSERMSAHSPSWSDWFACELLSESDRTGGGQAGGFVSLSSNKLFRK